MRVDIPRLQLADLPTPVETKVLRTAHGEIAVTIKRDDLTGDIYGGNKVRKLEYLLHKARARNAERVATFGTIASNHALATALYARSLGYECTCFLSNQFRTRSCARALNLHVDNGTEIIRFGGSRKKRISILRQYLRGRRAFLIPPGGSSWLGAVGFVNAALELAAQVAAGDLVTPDRIYIANGTMGSAVGLALGLALAGLATEVHAVRVTEPFVSSPDKMQRLLAKTAALMRVRDSSVSDDLATRVNYSFREGFLGAGYAKPNAATNRAIDIAREQLDLALDATYTGKAMAALLHDVEDAGYEGNVLFWNTYNSRPLRARTQCPDDTSGIPEEFMGYFY